MKKNNYGSLGASKRLVEAGINIKADCVWGVQYHNKVIETWKIYERQPFCKTDIPAPSMAEVWRELPEEIKGDNPLFLIKSGIGTIGYYHTKMQFSGPNPADVLIDLLIWVKAESKAKAKA